MSGMLYGVGGLAVVLGVLAIGFGVPANEGSFGNALIGSGTTAAVGGLIIIALGAAVARLERIAEALATRSPIRPSRPVEALETPATPRALPASARSPFPAMPDTRGPHPLEQRIGAPVPADMPPPEYPVQERAARNFPAQDFTAQDYPAQDFTAPKEFPGQSFAPTLHNPDEPSAAVADEGSLSPQKPMTPAPPPFAINGSGMAGKRQENRQDLRRDMRDEPMPESDRQPPPAPTPTRQPQTAYFDSMWPDQPKSDQPRSQVMPAKSPAGIAAKADPRRDQSLREALAAPAKRPAGEQPAAAAILKSGVVDGMGYTLYVDGSIEAELPQGTLRFASINELRSHLEKSA